VRQFKKINVDKRLGCAALLRPAWSSHQLLPITSVWISSTSTVSRCPATKRERKKERERYNAVNSLVALLEALWARMSTQSCFHAVCVALFYWLKGEEDFWILICQHEVSIIVWNIVLFYQCGKNLVKNLKVESRFQVTREIALNDKYLSKYVPDGKILWMTSGQLLETFN